MAQAVSFRSQTTEVRFQSQINSCEFCGGPSGNGSGSSLSTWDFLFSIIPPIPQTYIELLNQLFALASFCSKIFYTLKLFSTC
jgi:hypothetical protein